jgi:hypothetical protein
LPDASIVAGGLCDLFGLAQLHRGVAVASQWLVVLRKQKILLNSYFLLKYPLNFCDVKILASK